ncbi:MAG TPA: hypothetical protein VIU34_22275 [Steroidobacter sp.]
MKARHVITATVLVALGLLITWIARNTYWDEVTVPLPMKGEARTNSMYAAQRLAEAMDVTAQAQRHIDPQLAPDDVIYLSYWNWNLIPTRREQLQQWVESGGRLIADSTLIGGEQQLKAWTGIEVSELPASKKGDLKRIEPADGCADLEVETTAPDPYTSSDSYSTCSMDHGSRLTSSRRPEWILSDTEGMQAVRIKIGRGSFTFLNGTPFQNREIFLGDDALLFFAATGLDRGQRIHFLSEEKSVSLLELIWKHGAAVVLLSLAIVALALWRGSLRFGPPVGVPDAARRSLAEQIVGTGRFTLRFGGGRALHAATVRALHETAQRHISAYSGMPRDARIAALAQNTGLDQTALTEAINYAGPRGASELRKVVALLETARRRIS